MAVKRDIEAGGIWNDFVSCLSVVLACWREKVCCWAEAVKKRIPAAHMGT
jgi:hypothetical protein